MNAYEWLILGVFLVSTPVFIWFVIRESRKHKYQNRG